MKDKFLLNQRIHWHRSRQKWGFFFFFLKFHLRESFTSTGHPHLHPHPSSVRAWPSCCGQAVGVSWKHAEDVISSARYLTVLDCWGVGGGGGDKTLWIRAKMSSARWGTELKADEGTFSALTSAWDSVCWPAENHRHVADRQPHAAVE